MKKILCIITFSLLIVSCSDIINSDPNLKIDKETIFKVKTDQEHNVIMQLKIGNKWHYSVSEYYSNGNLYRSYIDSIVVLGDTLINNGRWFKVYCPMLYKGDYVLLTNLDKGLWCISPFGNNQSYLVAQFPDTNRYLNEKFLFSALTSKGDMFKDSCSRYVNCENDLTPIERYSISYKYTHWLEFATDKRVFNPYKEFNFVPEVGLIRHNNLYMDLSDKSSNPLLSVQYTIIDSTNKYLVQNLLVIDFGEIFKGDTKTGNFDVLSNFSGKEVNIMIIEFQVKMGMDLVILPYNKKIPDQSNFTLPLKVTPTVSGSFEGTIYIKTDAGEFDIKVKYTSR